MIKISHEITEENFLAQRGLFQKWAEEKGETFNDSGWARRVVSWTNAGCMAPIVAYHHDEAIGTVEYLFDPDPFDGVITAYGDHAYIVPQFRSSGVFQLLMDECEYLNTYTGAKRQIIPCGADGHDADFLVHFWKKRGFEMTGHIMTRTET